jgi:outer membrane protein assembly factor BamE (lipoprotein component of BamABCDE complex)
MRHGIATFGILFLLLTGCAGSLPRALDGVKVGMDKDQVLETAGDPKRTYREAMQDHWIYVYFEHDREWRRDVVFEEGKVAKITRPLGKEEWVKDLEKTKSMEEYEQKAREHQKKSEKFKSIDGSKDDGAE